MYPEIRQIKERYTSCLEATMALLNRTKRSSRRAKFTVPDSYIQIFMPALHGWQTIFREGSCPYEPKCASIHIFSYRLAYRDGPKGPQRSFLKASSIQIPDALALFSQADKEDTMLKINDNWISLRLHCDKMEVGTPCRLTNLAGTHAEIQR